MEMDCGIDDMFKSFVNNKMKQLGMDGFVFNILKFFYSFFIATTNLAVSFTVVVPKE